MSNKTLEAETRTSAQRLIAPLPLTIAALCAGVVAVIITGLTAGVGEETQISDPGVVTRWGLPIARFLHHLAMATAVTAAILACCIIPHRTDQRRRGKYAEAQHSDYDDADHPLYTRTLQIAAIASVVWTVAAIAVLVLTFSAVSGLPLAADEEFSVGLLDFMTGIDAGQAWLAVILIAGLFATGMMAIRSRGGIATLAVLGLIAILPLAMQGHSSSGDDHMAAVNSLGLHLLGVVIWVGGLVVLALLAPEIARTARTLSVEQQGSDAVLGTLLRRYSVLAGLAIVTVAASGVINAELRVTSFGDVFGTTYGLMLVAKTIATVLLAGIGFMHRQRIIPQLVGDARGVPASKTTTRGTTGTDGTTSSGDATGASTASSSAPVLLWRLILVEIAIMAAVIGVSTVLGRTPPPVPEEIPPDAEPAHVLTGYELPPEPSLANYFTLWRPDWLWIGVAVFLGLWYLYAMRKIRRRGDNWHVMRAVSWLTGLAVLVWITSGGPAIYGLVLFSGHMIQHMTLTMVAPIFLVMGSPMTLALRALPSRRDGTRGPREWILWLLHSKWSKFVTHPIIASANFAGSIILFYYTPIFGLALEYHVGHILMTVHFLLTGYIFALVLVGRDPLPSRPPHVARVVILLATMVFHAFFAVALMSSQQLIQADWFGNMGHGWFSAMMDQERGGELMWGLGEVPAVVLGIIACVQWAKDDTREMRRVDREADRTGDAELEEYNRMFEQLAERNAQR